MHRGVHRALDEDVEPGPVIRDVDLEALGHPVVAGAASQLLVERLDVLHVGERPGRLPDLFQRDLHGAGATASGGV